MYLREGGNLKAVSVDQALTKVSREFAKFAEQGGGRGVLSPFLTVEEAFLMALT